MPRTHNRTGRNCHDGRFIQVPYYLLNSPAYRRLSPVARAAWIEIAKIYNGSNNGRLAVSSRDLGGKLGISRSSAARAIQQLLTFGFLEVSRASSFSQKRIAAEYRLAHVKCDVTGKLPSKGFMRWQPG
jgi:hypothetical protein